MGTERILQISRVEYGSVEDEEILRRATEDVDPSSDEVVEVIVNLLDTKRHHDALCVGLAAPQIGKSVRVAIVQVGSDDLVMINPRIISMSGKKDVKRESCMSLWGFTAPVERREKVTVQFFDSDGLQQTEKFTGFTARIVQHEVDHLDGVLFDQRASSPLVPTDIFNGQSPNV